MKITSLGHGGAFAGMDKGNTSFLIESDTGKKLLFDCGTLTPYILRDEMGINFHDIDAIYISHGHADHVGGLPLILQSRFWIPKLDEQGKKILPTLIIDGLVFDEILDWIDSEVKCFYQGYQLGIEDFCNLQCIWGQFFFSFEGVDFTFVDQEHILYSAHGHKPVFGLSFEYNDKAILFTADTSKVAELGDYDIIFHDCETSAGFKSGVHAHLEDIVTSYDLLDEKPVLYMVHFTNEPAESNENFVWFKKGQTVTL